MVLKVCFPPFGKLKMLHAALFVKKPKRANKIVTVVRPAKHICKEDSISSEDDEDSEQRTLRITIYLNEKKKEISDTRNVEDTKTEGAELAEGECFICYKDDEDRFSQRYTLKMKTFSYYNVAVEMDQDTPLTYVILGNTSF